MATIIADGATQYGRKHIEVAGNKTTIKQVQGRFKNDPFANIIAKDIAHARHQIANAYTPKAQSMLQALATIQYYFKREDIRIDGDIECLEGKEGVIY